MEAPLVKVLCFGSYSNSVGVAVTLLSPLSGHPQANINWQVFFVEILYTVQVPTWAQGW